MSKITNVSSGRPRKSPVAPTELVYRVRAALKLTQEQMAQELKCSVSTVRDLERKRRLPGTHALKSNFAHMVAKSGIDAA